MKNPFLKPPKYSIGIDFGTTTSRLSYIDNYASINVPPAINPIRSILFPQKISNDEYSWLSDKAALASSNYFSKFKLYIGKPNSTLRLSINAGLKKEYISMRAEILAARIMWELYEGASQIKKELKNFKDVVITVPAEWNAIQRQATIKAGKIAGFSNIFLIEEPVAAYLAVSAYYPSDNLLRARNIMVFDHGGGTLDVTIIHRPQKGLPFVAGRSMDDDELGGEKIDELLSKEILGSERWKTYANENKKRIIEAVRQMKEALNPELGKTPMLNAPWSEEISLLNAEPIKTGELVLSHKQMNDALVPLSKKIIKCIDKAIESVKAPGFTQEDIDAIILVGGSSHLHMVQNTIQDKFTNKRLGEHIYLEQPEKIVAFGAALYKSYLDRQEKKFSLLAPMKTYLVYTDADNKTQEMRLDNFNEGRLPIKPKRPETRPIPNGKKNIHWKVYQDHNYKSKNTGPDLVESIKFQLDGNADRVRLDYEIDINGCLSKWEPSLIYRQKTPITTGEVTREYDWQNEEATEKAKEFSVHMSSKKSI